MDPIRHGGGLVDPDLLRKEKLRREMESLAAEQRIREYSRDHKWPDEDVDLVLQVLGLAESPPPLRAVSRR